MRYEVISEVETTLNTMEFMHFLRHIARNEVSNLYFKPVDFPYMGNATIGRLAFGIPGYQGHIWIREIGEGEEEGTKKMVLFFDHRSRFLNKEIKEDIKEMVLKALNKMGKRQGNLLISFTIPREE